MKVFFRHARVDEDLDFIKIETLGDWGSVVEGIIDHVDLDRRLVGIVIRNRQITLRAGRPTTYSVEVAVRYMAQIRKGQDWQEADEGWNGLPALLSEGFPLCS